jgi:hypothetical protein
MTTKPDLLTPPEFAEMARVTLAAVRKWAARGIGPEPKRPPGTNLVRYRRADVEAWLNGEEIPRGAAR